MSRDAVESARERFCAHVRAEDAVWDEPEPDPDRANEFTTANDTLVKQWASLGRAKELLLPLLGHGAPAIRGAAAAYLLRNGASDIALPVLHELNDHDEYGRAALNADSALTVWDKQHKAR